MSAEWWREHDTGFIAIGLFSGGLYGKFFLDSFTGHVLALLAGALAGLLLANFLERKI